MLEIELPLRDWLCCHDVSGEVALDRFGSTDLYYGGVSSCDNRIMSDKLTLIGVQPVGIISWSHELQDVPVGSSWGFKVTAIDLRYRFNGLSEQKKIWTGDHICISCIASRALLRSETQFGVNY